MWSFSPKPMTAEEREREIRRLEGVRDKLLDAAPKHFYAKRLILPVMLAATVLVIIDGARVHPANLTLAAGLFLAVFLFLLGHGTWKVWHSTPAPGDKWGFSDRIGYEGDSPRDIQRKIDDLRSEAGSSESASG